MMKFFITSPTHDRSNNGGGLVQGQETSSIDPKVEETWTNSLSEKAFETLEKSIDEEVALTGDVTSVSPGENDACDSGNALKLPAVSTGTVERPPIHDNNDDIPPVNPTDTTKVDTTTTTTTTTTADTFQSTNNNNQYNSPTASPQTPQPPSSFVSPSQHSFTLDDNNFGNSPGSVRSYSSQSTAARRSLALSRPAGMKERMQQRLRTAQSERNLMTSQSFPDVDDRTTSTTTVKTRSSSGSRRRRSSRAERVSLQPSLVRERLYQSWSSLPTVRPMMEPTTPVIETNEDSLLSLEELSQKVHPLELEEEPMEQKEMPKEQVSRVHRRRSKSKQEQEELPVVDQQDGATTSSSKSSPFPMPTSSLSLSAASAMLELQAKLDKAMLKISRLEQEQAHRDDLEDKYHDAQMMIASLRIKAASTTNNTTAMGRRLSGASGGTAQSLLSDSQIAIAEERPETMVPMMFHNEEEGEEVLKAPDSSCSSLLLKDQIVGRPRGESMDDATATTTSSAPAHSDSVTGLDDDLQQSRSQKLQKLKDFRKSRESQLKELVLDSQISPTDVQCVIRNLQDELKAAKCVMEQQTLQLKHLQEQLELVDSRADQPTNPDENVVNDENTTAVLPASSMVHTTDNELVVWRDKYRILQQRYTKLEMDRAWSEFQLRDRITADALKFHKRLRHWKEQTEGVQRQLEETMEQHAKETKDLRMQLSQQEQVALAAEQDLQEYKRGMQQTLKEYSATQDRLAKATALLAKYHAERSSVTSSHDPTIIQQAQFVELAKERKEEKNASWSAGWIGMIRQRGVETDPAIMG